MEKDHNIPNWFEEFVGDYLGTSELLKKCSCCEN
jgi:hypothetical protein